MEGELSEEATCKSTYKFKLKELDKLKEPLSCIISK